VNTKEIEQKWFRDIPSLVEAGLSEDKRYIELTAMTLVRRWRKEFPDISNQIAQIVSGYTKGAGTFRSAGIAPPADRDTNANLLQVENKVQGALRPLFGKSIEEQIERFMTERLKADELLRAGVFPANKLLLTGEPGTGKTMLATWLAQELDMKLAVFDLATSISSLLGNTGLNIKRIFSYAKQESVILFLDEFDAIAKRRDDSTDVGELKRIVNVLLKEMEDWPSKSILIAATNHPELLDPAIHRRFDFCTALPLPDEKQIGDIIERTLDSYSQDLNPKILSLASDILKGQNASDVVLFSNNCLKHHLLRAESIENSVLITLLAHHSGERFSKRGDLLRQIKKHLGNKISVRKLAQISGLSSTAVQHHLTKEVKK